MNTTDLLNLLERIAALVKDGHQWVFSGIGTYVVGLLVSALLGVFWVLWWLLRRPKKEKKINLSLTFGKSETLPNLSEFRITNEGEVEANEIHFSFEPVPDDIYTNYLYQNDYEYLDKKKRIIRIEKLYAKHTEPIPIVFNDRNKCEVYYSWKNPDGTRTERELTIRP